MAYLQRGMRVLDRSDGQVFPALLSGPAGIGITLLFYCALLGINYMQFGLGWKAFSIE
jgi:hypothetical protein